MDTHNDSEVDRLIDLALQAEQGGDIIAAIDLLKRAAAVAPLRTDVRENLARLLEESASRAPGNDAPPSRMQRAGRTSSLSHETSGRFERGTDSSAGDVDDQPRRTGLASAGQRPPIDDADTLSGSEALRSSDVRRLGAQAEPFAQRTSRKTASSSPEDDDFTRPQQPFVDAVSPSSEPRSDTPPVRRRRESPGTRSTKRAQAQASNADDLLSRIAETRDRAEEASWLPTLSARAKASIVLYLVLLSFVGVSSGVTYRKFFGVHGRTQESLAASESKSPGTVVASPAPSPAKSTTDAETPQVLRLARDYIAQKRYEDAATLLTNQLERVSDAGLRSAVQEELARAYDLSGTALLEKNKLLQSVTAYEKAVKLAPTKAVYLLHLANAHYYCGTLLGSDDARRYLEMAEREVSQVLQLEPRNLDAYQLQASLHECQRNVRGAMAALTKIIELAPPGSQEAKAAREKMNNITQAR
jgi:tetratricopeptide (TPR) repeat protein